MSHMSKNPWLRVTLLFLALLLVYMAIARFVYAPWGYYGSKTKPRFADPWIRRAQTILNGGLLYRDVFTTQPPLINYLLIPPTIFSGLFGHQNPWATLSFMLHFSLFNLLTAYVLLYMGETREEGYRAAVYFLLNPLTFGNSLLRRQDEPIPVFFFALSLLLILKRRHLKASIAIGMTALVKIWGFLMIPIAYIHSHDIKYWILPAVVFTLAFLPFLALAGESAIFWDVSEDRTQHPFQFGGVSPPNLWNRFHDVENPADIRIFSAIFVIGVAAMTIFVIWKRFGVLEDMTILMATVLILTPKLHCGYFSLLVLTLAFLLEKYRLRALYFLFGALALIADFLKFPVANYRLALGLSIAALLLLVVAIWRLCLPPRTPITKPHP